MNKKLLLIILVIVVLVFAVVLIIRQSTEEPTEKPAEGSAEEEPVEGPVERFKEAREASRDAHMSIIQHAIGLAMIDCGEGGEEEYDYCRNAAAVVRACRVSDEDWRFKPDASNCTIDDYISALDPLTDNPYFIDADGDYNVKIWADSDESEWKCNWDEINNECRGTNYKHF